MAQLLHRRTDPHAQRGSRAVLAVAAIRVALGAGMAVRPALLPRVAGVDRSTAGSLGWLVRMLGDRELALGLGALVSRGAPGWVAAGLLSDAGDAATLLAAARSGALSPVLAVLGASTSVSAVAVAVLDLASRDRRASLPAARP